MGSRRVITMVGTCGGGSQLETDMGNVRLSATRLLGMNTERLGPRIMLALAGRAVALCLRHYTNATL